MEEAKMIFKRLEPAQIAFLLAHIASRDEIPSLLEKVRLASGEAACGEPMVIIHGGAVKDGYLIEAAVPVSEPVESGEIHTRTLEAAPALIVNHIGAHNTIRETVVKAYDHIDKHAVTTSLLRREIYRILDPLHPENNLTELQLILHEWERLLSQGTLEVLGDEARITVMQGSESLTPEDSFEKYSTWMCGALERLDALTQDEDSKFRIVSRCAHVFPQERIDRLRRIFHESGVDAVLREMHTDHFWYEKPVRRGNVIHERKNPFDQEGYDRAVTRAEKRMAYCHCAFVRPYLNEDSPKLTPTFCYCGAGWYRRLWEGIIGLPVKIEYHQTLLRGDDQCTFTITLPLALDGEYLGEAEEAVHA